MLNAIHFISAAENDAVTIINLRKQIWATTYRGIYPDSMINQFDYAWHMDKELGRICNPEYAVYLIKKGNFNIGYLTIRKTDKVVLQSLYILEEYQHQGIGKLAFKFVNKYCEFNRFTNSPIANYKGEIYSLPFNMYTFNKMWNVKSPQEAQENWNARLFYEKMGGKIIGEDLDNEESWMNSVIYRFEF